MRILVLGVGRFIASNLRDVRVLRVLIQLVFLAVILMIFGWLLSNGYRELNRIGLLPNFDFLGQPSNFQVDEGLVYQPHTLRDSYGHAFVLGIVNTLRAALLGLVLTTLLGLVVGVARLSTNWLIRRLAMVYVELFQNTPVLVQLVFLYSGVFLTLPRVQAAYALPGPSYLSQRGLAYPALLSTDSTLLWFALVAAGAVVGIVLWRRRRRIRVETGHATYALEIGFSVPIIVALASWFLMPVTPFTVSVPQIQGSHYVSGTGAVVSPEFMALVLGLVLYTSAFIAEIVRFGIQSIPNGQWEAARAQGFSYFLTLRLIILPQALRVMIPPLTNQYLNLIKNSSLGAAVGYAELFGVSRLILQSGQSVPVIVLVMVIYLIIDLFAAFLMNILNQRVQLQTR